METEKVKMTVEKPKPEKAKPVEKPIDKSDDEWVTIGSPGGTSCYGHRLNTLASLMDNLINAGKYTTDQIESELVKHSPTKPSAGRAKQALHQHIQYLGKGNNPGALKVEVKKNSGSKNPALTGVIQAFKVSEKAK